MCLYTTIVSLFFKKKKKKRRKRKKRKEKDRGDIHNQSINHWCLTHLSCISEGLYGWVKVVLIQAGCYCYELGLTWIICIWSYTSYFKDRSLPLPSHKIILPLSLKSYLILKVHGWYVFGIKTRDENGINLVFPGIQHPFQEIFFRCFSGCFCIHMWYSQNFFFPFCSHVIWREKPLLLCVFFQNADDLREVLE